MVFITGIKPKLTPNWEHAIILEKFRENSYKLKFSDGKISTVHANKLKPYIVATQHIVYIQDTSTEFGKILYTPINQYPSSTQLDISKLTFKSPETKEQLIPVLKSFAYLFSNNIPKQAIGVCHQINLKEGEIPKKPPVYSIPEKLRPEVQKQIQELFDYKLIEKAKVPIAYPIVCATKKDGQIRMCVDLSQTHIQ